MKKIFNKTNILLGLVIFTCVCLLFGLANLQESFTNYSLELYEDNILKIYNLKSDKDFLESIEIPTNEKLTILNMAIDYENNKFEKALGYFNNILIIVISSCFGALTQRIVINYKKEKITKED